MKKQYLISKEYIFTIKFKTNLFLTLAYNDVKEEAI